MSILTTIFGEAANVVTGGLAGGILRLVPEVLRLFTAKADRDHEYRMAELQRDMAKDGSEQRIREAEAAGAIAVDSRGMDAYVEAIKATGQRTGNKLADGLNALVRPITMYYYLGMYALYKLAMFVSMLLLGVDFSDTLKAAWTSDDVATLGLLINFYFVGRVLDKRFASR